MNRDQATWTVCYAYLVYLFLSEIPALNNFPLFSVQAAFVLLVVLYLFSSYLSWGLATASKFLVATWLVSYVIEFIGVETGLPFGNYSYTSAMGPFVGPVPLFIPFLWCALGYFCLRATGPSVVAPALLMVLLDLSLDPLFSLALWNWQSTAGPQYFGVPVLNFFGWFLTAIVIFGVFRVLTRKEEWRDSRRRSVILSGGTAAAIGFYVLFGVSTVLYQLLAGLLVGAAVSTILYAIAAAVLWRKRTDRRNHL